MKRIFLAASLIIAASAATNALQANSSAITVSLKSGGDDGGTHITASQVPAAVLTAFHATFPMATNAQWQKEREHGTTVYQVDFNKNGNKWRAVFAPDGTLLSSGRR